MAKMIISASSVINISSNEVAVENRVENNTVVTKVNPSISLGMVENYGGLKRYFCSEVVFT